MPQWGLTQDMRDEEPWGLPAAVLAPDKVVTDPIHGDIYLNVLERAIVDSPAFQRLRGVRQLGMAHLVYPGATHTRFAHSLGTLRVAQDLFDVAFSQRDTRHGRPDIFEEWRQDLGVDLSRGDDHAQARAYRSYLKKVGEAMVVTRLGALLHDIGHVPFGHSVEDDLQILDAHDENTARFIRLWDDIGRQHVRVTETISLTVAELIKAPLRRHLRPLILSKEKQRVPQGKLKFPFAQDIIGNTICADLIDYLQRDHLFTGLPLSLGDRYMSGFYVTRGRRELFPGRMTLNIHRGGRERADIVTELLKHLRYRYELQERVIVHHAKLSADAMIGKMLELLRDAMWAESASALIDPPAFAGRDRQMADARDISEIGDDVRAIDPHAPSRIDTWVKERLEELFLAHGDDGLLEHLRDVNQTYVDGRRGGVSTLSRELLDRKLFRRAARARGAKAAKELYERFHRPETRRQLERDAAAYAEISDGWKVVIWLPKPEMRLKQAEVLVDHGDGISQLVEYSPRGKEIYDEHKALWSIWVFVHRDVTPEEQRWVLARLSKTMLVHWDGYERDFGPDAESAPDYLAARLACSDDALMQDVNALCQFAEQRPMRGGNMSGPQLAKHYERLRKQMERRGRGR
jgi:HD superfamily phosphohydrolase